MRIQKIWLYIFYFSVHCAILSKAYFIEDRQNEAYDMRRNAARYQIKHHAMNVSNERNKDEKNVADFAGNFTKLFEHNAITGVLSENGQENYKNFLRALKNGDQKYFDRVQRMPNIERVFVNPHAGYMFSMDGCDTWSTSLEAPPLLGSKAAAADMIEVYLMQVLRDVEFKDYGTGRNTDNDGQGSSLTNKAAAVMTDFIPEYIGPRNQQNQITAAMLFRGGSPGDLIGPYVSQFLLQPLYPLFPAGCAGFVAQLIGVQNLDQDVLLKTQRIAIAEKREFGVSWADFIGIQNGFIPRQYTINDYNQTETRYPINGRDLGSYVHSDSPLEPYYNAMNIIAYRGFPLCPNLPYSKGIMTNESAGPSMGMPNAYSMMGQITNEALKAAWVHKWMAYRRLRPEAMAGLIHQVKVTGQNPYGLHESMFQLHADIDVLDWVLQHNLDQVEYYNGALTQKDAYTYLLSQMFPEGSPAHPAYPSGHATIAGACITVIQALFNGDTKIIDKMPAVTPNPNDPAQLAEYRGPGYDTMTLWSELNKLASNVAYGRNFGGVHYRWDAEYGILLGESLAIRFLQDRANVYVEEEFNGFELRKRDGTKIRITAEKVEVIS